MMKHSTVVSRLPISRGRCALLVASLLVAWGEVAEPAALELSQPLDSRAVVTQLHNRLPAERAAAVRKLAAWPAVEGAKLAVQTELTDREPEVRHAAYRTLLTWKDNDDVAALLLKTIEREARGKGATGRIVPLLGILAASQRPETQGRLGKFLEPYLAKSKDAAATLAALADGLEALADEQAVASLTALAQQKSIQKTFAYRRAIVQALAHISRREAVASLVALLPKLDGEVRGDIIGRLEEISGERNGGDVAAWQAWWKKHRDDFEFPAKGAGRPGDKAAAADKDAAKIKPAPQGVSSYYGLPLYARRIVFVIDVSGSMSGPRLDSAKRELTSVINGLPEDDELAIVAFSSRVWFWRRELTRATPAAKQEAAIFVYQLAARGRTATYDALDTAFHYDAEAIYLLSDGAPNYGTIPMPAAILAAVGNANRSRRLSIYSIGISPGPPDSPMESFMKMLAEQNYGRYKRLD
jgi:hypothetical protein